MRTKADIAAEIRALGGQVPGESEVPVRTKADIAAELKALGAEPPRQEGIMHRLGQLGRGFLAGAGEMYKNAPYGHPLYSPYEDSMETEERFKGFEPAELLPEALGLGEEFEPEKQDTLGKVLKTTGEFLVPTPYAPVGGYGAVAKAVPKGAKAIAKALGKEAALTGGAATAIEATPRLTEKGTASGSVEDFVKGLLGSVGAGTAIARKSIPKVPTENAAAAKKIYESAEKHGVKLPFNVGLRNRTADWFNNNVFSKSLFTSKVYDEALKESNQSMVDAVKNSIKSVGSKELAPTEASNQYRAFLDEQKQFADKVSDKLYAKASKLAKPTDVVKPIHTQESIKKLGEILNADIKSGETKKVADYVAQLSHAWGMNPPDLNLKALEADPRLISKYLAAFEKQIPEISVDRLVKVRKEINGILKYEKEVPGMKGNLKRLRHAIDLDIDASPNQDFVKSWRGANRYEKTRVADMYKGDIARSILDKNHKPSLAFDLLNDVHDVQEIKRIVGKNSKGKEILDNLMQAKLRQIFENATKDESLALHPFIKLFDKNEKKGELIKEIIGTKEYNKLKDVSEIAKEFQASGRSVLNTSATAPVAADINTIKGIGKSVVAEFLGAGAGATAFGPVGAAAPAITTNVLSRLVANPRFVNMAHAYAVNRKKGNEKMADTIIKQMIKQAETEARIATSILNKETNQGD